MKKYLKKSLLGAIIALSGYTVNAQVSWNGQLMTRSEYRHGFGSLIDSTKKEAIFTSQRARIGFKYDSEKFRIGVTAQDIRTWGSTGNLPVDNAGLLSIYEAWGELQFNSKTSFKFGRQAIAYDEDRIFGSLDWAMQGRRHDAAIFKYADSTFTAHAGVAYNQDKEQQFGTVYTVANNYKAFQYLWLEKKRGNLTVSALLLNNGVQFKADSAKYLIKYGQTAGLRAAYKKNKLFTNAAFYYQAGKDAADKKINAYDASFELGYDVIKDLKLSAGVEILSGTSQTDTANKDNNSFNPLYGTNHRFNGYMDYFYVGNHFNSVGLQDIYFKVLYNLKNSYVSLNAHSFAAAADVKNKKVTNAITAMNKNLGTELDLTFGYKITEGVGLQVGYSQMFATETMEAIKGGDKDKTNNWAYVMILIRPGVKFPRTGLKM